MKPSFPEPPERSRRSPSTLRRIELAIPLFLGSALFGLWFLGDQASAYAAMDASLPSSGGGLGSVGLLVALIALYGTFVAAETSVDQLRPMHIRFLRDSNTKKAEALQGILDRRQSYVAVCAVGADFTRIAIVFVGFVMAPGVAKWMEATWGRPYDFGSLMLAAALVALPVSLLNLVVSVIPKSAASLQPHVVVLRLQGFLRLFAVLLGGPAWLVATLAGTVAAWFGTRASFAVANQAEEEIKTLVESAQESGEIESDEKELLHSVFEFTDTVAREVMTPRVDLDAMPVDSDPTEVLAVIRSSGHSRIPLYEGTDDEIVGIIHAKDLLVAMLEGGKTNLRKLMRPAHFVPENKNLHDLLAELRLGRGQMAIVQDEFGGTAGVVTTEDIVEELVGDIVDEYDNEEPEVVANEGGWMIDGRTHLDDVNEEIGSELESDEFDTVAGFVFGLFGRQPKSGECIESGGYRFEVSATDGRRISKLRVSKLEPVHEDSSPD